MQSDFDQMFSLRDVFYYILKRWRSIILFGLIGSILIGGFTCIKSEKKASTTVEVLSDDLDSAVKKLTNDEKKEIEKNILENDAQVIQFNYRLEYLRERYQKLNDQLANSLYLSMSDTEQFFFEFDVKIELNSKDDMDQAEIAESLRRLLVEYNNQFLSDAFFKYIEYQTNGLVPYDQVKDLVKTDINSSDNIHVTLTAPGNILPSLKNAVELYVENKVKDSILLPFSFDSKIMNEVSSIDSNEEITKQLAEINEQISALSSEIDQYEIKLQDRKEEAKPIYSEKFLENKLNIETETIPSAQVNNGINKQSLAMYMIIGFLLGAFLIVIWYVFILLSSKNVFDVKDLSNDLGLMMINPIYVFGGKHTSKIDKWINTRYLKQKNHTSNSIEEQISYSKAMIEVLIKKTDSDVTKSNEHKVGLVGELTDDESVELIEKIKDSNLFSAFELPLSLNSETELEKLDEANSLVLIIRTHHTKIKQVLYYVELAKKMKKEILGVISIESL